MTRQEETMVHRSNILAMGQDYSLEDRPPLYIVPDDVSCYGDKLCKSCRSLDLNPRRFVVLPDDKEWGEENVPDDIEIRLGYVEDMRSNTSCPLCRLVLVAAGGDKVPTHHDGERVVIELSWNTDGPMPDPSQPWSHTPVVRVLRPYIRTEAGGFVDSGMDFNLFPDITLLANDLPADIPTTTDPSTYFIRPICRDRIDFSLVRRWLSICEKHHNTTCRENPILKQLKRSHPTKEIADFRCIDVQQNCLTRPPVGSQYAALSYLWGRRKFFTTLKSNVADLEKPFSLDRPEFRDRIPATIKDAIQIAREVNIPYIWVDSLCIVQDDSQQEKMQHIKMMDLVYSAADLVIVAAGSTDAFSGIPGIHPGTRGPRQPIEEIAPGFRLAFRTRWQDSIRNAAYYTRGWTFQEDHFAVRSLVFLDGKVTFRCRGISEWEEHCIETADEIAGLRGERDEEDSDGGDIGTFEGLIQSYSDRVLTYDSDIYNAFAGVSRQLTFQLNTDLCHGVPTAFFDWFLLWEPLGIQERRVVAPSWSWAGWVGESWSHIWDWYTRDIEQVENAIRERTWIVWYQRQGHTVPDSRLLDRGLMVEKSGSPKTKTVDTNLYGAPIHKRFKIKSSTTKPSAIQFDGSKFPTYVEDTLSRQPGSGFLQFWTISIVLELRESKSKPTERGPTNKNIRTGIFGTSGLFESSGHELGVVLVRPSWLTKNPLPQKREFILLCEARDARAKNGSQLNRDKDFRFKAMLVEWVDQKGQRSAFGSINGNDGPMYAERVAIGSIGRKDVGRGLDGGATWKEIVLG